MPGTLTVKPMQANLTRNKDFLLNRMDPYCEVLLGGQKVTTHVCHSGGKHPSWSEVFNLHSNNEPTLYVNLKDRDRLSHDDNIGMVQVDLRNVSSIPRGPQWYPVTGSHGSEGELLLDISFNPGNQIYNQPGTQMYGQPAPVYGGTPMQAGFPGQMQPTMQMAQPTMQMAQPTVAYNATPTYPTAQPMTGYPTVQPMMAQQAYPGTQPTMAYTQPMGTVGVQPQIIPNQGYAPTGYGGQVYYK